METIKQERKEAFEFCRGGHGRYYKMMINLEDAQIWSDVFLSVNNWKEYHSDAVHQLENVCRLYVEELEDAYVSDAIRLLSDAGWTITD